ncbi:alpha/beta fold hydrolase [Microlunatus antarcticus]|uniref:Pimeloyl-ACP methyl ester carboxylesterase n=1 Tax=Microlunatus antarcticus TaxID=53388 RepID=A0A7W5JV06_9ACTN|nr:alpha/beta hydrolase [Microlunatus antarcticus]MBB3326733.1 pimeloyl-ACP methyl ester carboxylesterase [Microlunatus antarcticus]
MADDETRDAAAHRVAGRRDGTTDVRGVELGWTSEGEGPLTVFAHGMANDRWSGELAGLLDWSPLVAGGQRLLRYDARGHGRSTGRAVAEDYRWPDLADDLLALLDVLSPDRPVRAVGASMGSATLVHAALAAPDRFERLVLTCPPTAWATRAAQAGAYLQGADLVEQHGVEAFERAMSAQPKQGLFRDLPDYPPRLRVSDALLPSVLRGAAASDLPDDARLRTLQLPVLVLSWHDDPGHPVETGERLVELIDGAELGTAATVTELRTWGSRTATFLGG